MELLECVLFSFEFLLAPLFELAVLDVDLLAFFFGADFELLLTLLPFVGVSLLLSESVLISIEDSRFDLFAFRPDDALLTAVETADEIVAVLLALRLLVDGGLVKFISPNKS